MARNTESATGVPEARRPCTLCATRSFREAWTGTRPTPLPPGEGGLVSSQIQPFSPWERVASFRPASTPLPLGEGGRRPGEGAPIALPLPFPASPIPCFSHPSRSAKGYLHRGTLTPTLSQRERGSEGCDAKNAPDHAPCLLALYCWWLRSRAARQSGSKSRCATGSASQWPWVSVPRSSAALAWSKSVWCTCGAMKWME